MAATSMPGQTSPLAPSELVLLHGEQFAKKVMIGNVKLLRTGDSVSAAQLGEALLAVTFLSCEQAGAIRLEVRQKKALLGLRTVKGLFAMPGNPAVLWPPYCLESEIRPLSERLWADKESNEVTNIIYSWLHEDTTNPWVSALELVKAGMAARGMLAKVEERKLMILKVAHYELPESTATLAMQCPVEPYKSLLQTCESTRPEVWKLLVKQIKSAIKARTEEADVDYD